MASIQQPDDQAAAVMKGGYWPTWTAGTFPSTTIETSLFTHVYYSFLSPSSDTYTFQVSDSDVALLSNFIAGLQAKSPRVKTLISIGGGGNVAATATLADMASNRDNRKAFIDSSIQVARRFGFDGLDLDWEFPNNPKQMEDYGFLLQEWRAAVTIEALATGQAPLLLAAAVNFASDMLYGEPRSYPAQIMAQNLDWINAMCYDYHGDWEPTETGPHAAFYDPRSRGNSSFGLQMWIQAGMPKNKIILGLPMYGRTWNLTNPGVNGIRAPANGVGPGNNGYFPYNQVVEFNQQNNATIVYDPTTVSTYSYSGKSWVSYDDVTSVKEKIKLAKGLELGGYFFWALGEDSSDRQLSISVAASRAWI